MKTSVEAVLAEIRSQLRMDGGDVELVDVTNDGVVSLRFVGCCRCPMSTLVLKAGIENKLKERIADVKKVSLAF